DDHFGADPDRCVLSATRRRAASGRICPTIHAGIVPAAGAKIIDEITSTPDDHFGACPDCSVLVAWSWRISGGGSCPAVSAWVISSASVRNIRSRASTPDNHFTPSPDGTLSDACSRCANNARRAPSVIGAAVRRIRYYRKRIIGHRCHKP